MTGKDKYYNRAKQEGYRARSAFKLRQLDRTAGLLGTGNTVVDLGAAPGGWLQVAAEEVGQAGQVVGVDRQRIDPLEDPAATVTSLRADVTDDGTADEIRRALDGDDRPVDTMLSDMAPNMTGEYTLDHARSVHLARQAFELADDLLATGGSLAVKVFDGRDLDDLVSTVETEFEYVREVRPDASRDASSELYLVAKNRLTTSVRPGDELEVEIVDTGSEGDGIARIDGFTLFVPDTAVGDQVTVQVDTVKPRFGFAEPIDSGDS